LNFSGTEEFVTSGVGSSGEVVNKDILKVLDRELTVVVDIVGYHEIESFSSVGWMIDIQAAVEVSDECSSFLAVQETRSVVVVSGEKDSS